MPQLFGSLSYVNPENVYAGSPVDEAKALNQSASTEYQSVLGAKNALDVMASNLDVEDRNFGIKKKAIDDIKGRFEQLTADGDYQNARMLVTEAVKNFQTNNEVIGALKSKAQYDAYKSDLDKRLAENKITTDQYSYATTKSKAANSNPLTYNPETGQYNGIFKGTNVVNDMSGEIYDKFNERIKDWKEGSILNADGNQYMKSANSPTGYFNMTTGKEVKYDEVQSSLRKELEGTGEYKDFLNQEAAIDMWKRTKNPDGTQRNLTKDDLGAIGFDDDMIKTAVSGVSQEQLDKLKASKRPSDQKEYERLSGLRDAVDPSALSQADIDNVYAQGYRSKQIDKYTSPAANKASFRLYDNKFLEDHFGLENLKFQHDAAIKKLEQQNVFAPPTNLSATVDYTYDMYNNSLKKQNELSTNLSTLKQRKADFLAGKIQLPPEQVTQLDRDIAQSQAQYDVLSKGQSRMHDELLANSQGRVQATAVFQSPQEATLLVHNILNLPYTQKSTKLQGYAEEIQKAITNHTLITPDLAKNFAEESQKYPEAAKMVNDYTKSKMITPGSMLAARMKDEEVKYFDTKNNISMSTNVLALDPNEKGKLETETQRQTNYWTNLLQSGTDFSTMDGKNLREIAGHAYDGTLYKADGTKLANPMLGDITKMSPNLTTKEIDGNFYLQVPLVDSQGHQLYEEDKSGNKLPAYKLVKPADQTEIKSSLRNIGTSWATQGGDNTTQVKGIQLLGQVNFADQLAAFKPSYLEDKVPFTMYSTSTPQGLSLQIVKLNDVPDQNNPGQFTPAFGVYYPDGTPVPIKDLDGTTDRQSFTSKEELMTLLQYNFNQ